MFLEFIVYKLKIIIMSERELLEYFKTQRMKAQYHLQRYIDELKLHFGIDDIHIIKILENDTCKMLAYNTTTYDNVPQVANITKILIEMTFTILQEKNL